MKIVYFFTIALLITLLPSCKSEGDHQAFIYIKEELQSSLGHPQNESIQVNAKTESRMRKALSDGLLRFNCILRSGEIPNLKEGKETIDSDGEIYSTYVVMDGKIFLMNGRKVRGESSSKILDVDIEKLLAEKCSNQT